MKKYRDNHSITLNGIPESRIPEWIGKFGEPEYRLVFLLLRRGAVISIGSSLKLILLILLDLV